MRYEVRFGFPSGWHQVQGLEVDADNSLHAVYVAWLAGGGKPLEGNGILLDKGPNTATVRPIFNFDAEAEVGSCTRNKSNRVFGQGFVYERSRSWATYELELKEFDPDISVVPGIIVVGLLNG